LQRTELERDVTEFPPRVPLALFPARLSFEDRTLVAFSSPQAPMTLQSDDEAAPMSIEGRTRPSLRARNVLVGFDEPVLVTGAGGFIGSRVVETLLRYGFTDVTAFVRSKISG